MSEPIAGARAAGREVLAAAGVALPDLDASLLLGAATGLDATGLLSRGREPLSPGAARRFRALLRRRASREPLAYLTGEREFWSLRLAVDPRVLIPRPETETLVEEALRRLPRGGRVADVGTGSGAVAVALAVERPDLAVWATDLSAGALEVARDNARAHGAAGRIVFATGDLAAPLSGLAGSLDAVVSNPPYVPDAEIAVLEPEVREHEPRLALAGGGDGLRVVARLLEEAPALLRRGGWLLLELGAGQAGAVRERAAAGPWDRVETRADLAGIERVVALRHGG